MLAKVFSIQMLQYFSQIVPTVCTLVLFNILEVLGQLRLGGNSMVSLSMKPRKMYSTVLHKVLHNTER